MTISHNKHINDNLQPAINGTLLLKYSLSPALNVFVAFMGHFEDECSKIEFIRDCEYISSVTDKLDENLNLLCRCIILRSSVLKQEFYISS